MKDEIKTALKDLIKKAIPDKAIVDAIMKAEKHKKELKNGIETVVENQKRRLELAVEAVTNALPFPFNLLVGIAKTIVIEAVTEAVQEEFNEIKAKLKEQGVNFSL